MSGCLLGVTTSDVAGQDFNSKINDELTPFTAKVLTKNVSRLPFGIWILPRASPVAPQHVELK
jgi:hypothetical protein